MAKGCLMYMSGADQQLEKKSRPLRIEVMADLLGRATQESKEQELL